MSASRLFLAMVWTALTTALLSALLPAGLPHSTSFGSAFNPATTSVALKAGADRLRIAADRIASGDDDVVPAKGMSGTGHPALPAVMAELTPPVLASDTLPPAAGEGPALAERPFSTAYPRGPPTA